MSYNQFLTQKSRLLMISETETGCAITLPNDKDLLIELKIRTNTGILPIFVQNLKWIYCGIWREILRLQLGVF